MVKKAATISRTLIDRDKLVRGHLLDVGERQLHRLVDLTLDIDRELVRIDIERHVGEMVTHEEGIVRRDDVLVEH